MDFKRSANRLNVRMSVEELTEREKEQTLDPEIVDQIFDEFDSLTTSMIEGWSEDINWGDRDELVAYLRLKRMAKRSSALDKIVLDRLCPMCKNKEIRDSHWRIDKYHSSAICMKCFQVNHKFRTINSKFYPGYDEWEIISLMHNIFLTPTIRYKINGRNLQQMRAMLGISQTKLSEKLGYVTPMAIHLLEEGSVKTMTKDKVVKCLKVFREGFIQRLKELGYSDIELERYEFKKPEIEEVV